MNIKFPTSIETQSALQAEYYVISGLSLVQQYIKGVSFDSDSEMVINGFALYEYEDEDLDEVIYMCVEFNYEVDNESFIFGEFIEPGGFDMIDEADEYLRSLHNVKLIENNF
ncbi:hypothetical protein Acj61p036 [Acinetobacter phage Acj61]|uniref:Uncharacterized protein n=1 Tax=Acinetobacter phage Acj61 TaxID=760732 RepID=E5E417_9CAUD|nr:hypothetical protein Acj61p036 [Acinetobacter phage Acj61]ADG36001.1 hypothetical protein Acj61p036 [Acinetobacter phage Acj61]